MQPRHNSDQHEAPLHQVTPHTSPRLGGISRRLVLGGGAASAFVVAGGAPAFAALAPGGEPAYQAVTDDAGSAGSSGHGNNPRRRAYSFLDAGLDAYPAFGRIRLAQSYTDQSGLFSTAFVYDNALAALAYLAQDRPGSLSRALTIGDALLFAQANDPEYDDGRLRQAYNVGPYTFYDGSPQPDGFVRGDGKANVGRQFGFVGTAVGDVAWVGLALVALACRTRASRFKVGAVRIADWIVANSSTTEPLGGFKFGVDGANKKLPYTSTEHNIDLVALFGQLAQLTGDRRWYRHRATAAAFVEKMWNADEGFFWTGTNDGVTINRFPVPEDTQTWSYLAAPLRRYARSLDWASGELSVVDDSTKVNSTVPAGLSFQGVTFSSASLIANENNPIAPFQPKPNRSGVWFEGNAHLAAALRLRGGRHDEALARRLLESNERAQDTLGVGQSFGGKPVPERAGIVSSSSPLDTGFGYGYYPYRHIGGTAWYLLASACANPLGREPGGF